MTKLQLFILIMTNEVFQTKYIELFFNDIQASVRRSAG